MTYTKHGHHIPGTVKNGSLGSQTVARCGGVRLCKECIDDAAHVYLDEIVKQETLLQEISPDQRKIDNVDPQIQARVLVEQYLNTNEHYIDSDEIFVVWFCYTLGNWKCLLSTTKDDDQYYEVTFRAEKNEIYLDCYKKAENVVYDFNEVWSV